jgi:hypothetical protein
VQPSQRLCIDQVIAAGYLPSGFDLLNRCQPLLCTLGR